MKPVRNRLFICSAAVMLVIVALFSGVEYSYAESLEEPILSIVGLVEHPINITYSEFRDLPSISEEVTCTCVGPPSFDVYTYNWTGVAVSTLLDVAGVKQGALDVVFYATDGYSSSLPMEKALTSDTILAVEANGEPLTKGTGYPFMLVVPCWWGYKWVKFVERIEVVDYDHVGTWESGGYPDYAEIPDCVEQEKREEEKEPIVFSTALAISGVVLLALGVYLVKVLGRR